MTYGPVLVSIGLASVLTLPTLLDGVERKLKAAIQSRIGPPIHQTLLDLTKLFRKELVLPRESMHTLYMAFTYLSLSIVAISSSIASIALGSIELFTASVILLSIIQAIHIAMPFTTYNPFSIVGASRELVLAVINESALLITVGLAILVNPLMSPPSSWRSTYFLLLLELLIVSYIASGRTPYDIAEAEPEIASGWLIEFSGPLLGVIIYTNLLRKAMVKLIVGIVLAGLTTGYGSMGLLLSLIAMTLLWVAYTVASTIVGRSRVDVAPKTMIFIHTTFITLLIVTHVLGV
ncbi:MAG: NADH-quinone oxidoreductase subunit H [Desulfurococcaceae archaeon]|nr:NADH-quinone oxidoreductase subunit H [Sulfolobales archaeon]MDW8169678.1 NADH-quinone oxidoreductase subunit H [Desulfurococcaceae archaeon]